VAIFLVAVVFEKLSGFLGISFSEISQVCSDFEKEISEIEKQKVMSIATPHTWMSPTIVNLWLQGCIFSILHTGLYIL